jgi:hypothetical protein
MAIDHIRYDILAQEALRGMVRTVLGDVAKNGLPGDHHFYISVDTRAEGVKLPPRVRSLYPDEITLVLQHQFWDLKVDEDHFEVGLAFGGVAERLIVPFTAIKGFFDPSVQFALQFEELSQAATETAPPEDSSVPAAKKGKPNAASKSRPPAEHKKPRTTPAIAAVPKPANSPSDEGPDKPPGSGEVVRLDRFRKK